MADEKPLRLVKLTPEILKEIRGTAGTIAAAKAEIERLRKLGMDVKYLEDQLKWAETMKDTLLREYGD